MIERRKHPRVKSSLTAIYHSDICPRSRAVSAVDLGLGGIRIETTPHTLAPDEDLEISFVIHPRVIKCKGKVVHILRLSEGRQQAGIRFEDLSKQDRLCVEDYLSLLTGCHLGEDRGERT